MSNLCQGTRGIESWSWLMSVAMSVAATPIKIVNSAWEMPMGCNLLPHCTVWVVKLLGCGRRSHNGATEYELQAIGLKLWAHVWESTCSNYYWYQFPHVTSYSTFSWHTWIEYRQKFGQLFNLFFGTISETCITYHCLNGIHAPFINGKFLSVIWVEWMKYLNT